MRYGPQLMFLGLLFAAAAAPASPPWPVLVLVLWSAASLFAVGLTLMLRKSGLFMKQADGRRHWLSVVLLLPYGLLNAITFHVYRLAKRTPWDEVTSGLYLGRRLTRREAAQLGPDATVDLTCEFSEPALLRQGRYLAMPVLDTQAPSPEQLGEGVAFIESALRDGRVYVHCALGHGRSATLVAAWLLATGRCANVDEAEATIKAARPTVCLHAPQRAALERFVESLSARVEVE